MMINAVLVGSHCGVVTVVLNLCESVVSHTFAIFFFIVLCFIASILCHHLEM